MASHDLHLPPGFILENYRIERVLGAGGFGVTYLAHDLDLDAPVAIKEFFPSHNAARAGSHSVIPRTGESKEDFDAHRDRFLAEARTLARLSDVPGIVSVRRLFRAHGTAYIVMAYVEGESLSSRIKRLGPGPAHKVLPIIRRLAEGLEKVHAAGFLHRDIKPGNILLDMSDEPVLIDFGAARLSMGAETQALSVILTPGYAPIEQYSERARQGPWTDIYGLAAVACFAVTGKRPVDAVSVSQGEDQLPLDRRDGSPEEQTLFEAIRWGMQPQAPDRPQTVAQWRRKLDETAQSAAFTGATAPRPTPSERLHERTVPIRSTDRAPHGATLGEAPPARALVSQGRRTAVTLGGGVVAILAIAILAFIVLRPGPSKRVDNPDPAGAIAAVDSGADAPSSLTPFVGSWKLSTDRTACAQVPADQLIAVRADAGKVVVNNGKAQVADIPDADGWYRIDGADWRVRGDKLQIRSGPSISEFERCS